MPKRRTYEQILLYNLRTLPVDIWFDISKKPDYEKMVGFIKIFIDTGEPYTLRDGEKSIMRLLSAGDFVSTTPYHKMDRLPEGVTVHKVGGNTISITCSGRNKSSQTVDVRVPYHYEVRCDGKVIAIESI